MYEEDIIRRKIHIVNKNPFDKTIHGVGYLGSFDNNGVKLIDNKSYITWVNILTRCYSKKKSKRDYVYDDCTVINEWHNYQIFKKWYDENYYELDGCKMNLDKDILIKGCKIYSPDTCVFVPRIINTLFIKSNRIRGNYPLGVHFNKEFQKIKAQCKKNNKVYHLGYFENKEDAFYAYKDFKEEYIKEVANEYIDRIPSNLYQALINYKVEITD